MPSSVVASHSYDPASGDLTIRFTTGRAYVYLDVQPEVAAAFAIALSKGAFFNARIRDHYRCREIDPASGTRLW
jgi:hypothetical protein